ncbi:winged helix-turn-helix transcriptional regulator [Haloarcula halophila]|uniref:winged helix-turn-helix transcriptional regulator n=1 Tax=Haloarcula TaxID=2237 RepID=UPI0023E39176|nr:winged helix-turn-helix transcriptional regulator [Halomicroarcula sp. DFY41]
MGLDRLTDQVDKESRDLAILEAVIESGPIGIVRLAEETGIAEHKVRYSLRMLEDDELVEPTPQGAVPADNIDERIAAINEGIDDLVAQLTELRGLTPSVEPAESGQ